MQTKRFFIVVFLCFFSLFLLGCKKEKESSDQSYIYSLARNAVMKGLMKNGYSQSKERMEKMV